MNLRDLHYLCMLADEGHFGRAAEACNVSQSTLSIQLKKLEEFLGVQLIERGGKTVLPTAVGADIIQRARGILQEADAIRQLARDARDPLAGELTLGAFPTLAPYLFPLCLRLIRQTLPAISLRLVEEKTHALLNLLADGKLDCALIAAPVEAEGLVSRPLFHEPFLLAVPTAHPMAKKKTVSHAELATLELLLLDDGHCLRRQALDVCQAIGSGESRRFRATSLETLRQMVALGDAVTLIPALAAIPDEQLRYIPLQDKAIGRTITLSWRATSARTKLFEKLAEIVRSSVSTVLPT